MNNMLKTMMGYLYDPHGIQFATVLNSYHTVLQRVSTEYFF